ncbi:MAG: UDP-N-acetylmuramate dehydrogenase [Clostridiales bacterium]|jgi:UDP-N-acetylmuramate dehydrogenase|nr:UDP-N-acetylmuramate dehydrogenase [Clostridiales bacterium]
MYDKDIIYQRMLRYRMKGRVQKDAALARETSFQIGGPADILFFPENIAEAVRVLKLCRRERIPLLLLGNGTNVLVRDGGVRGVVMKLGGGLCELRRERDRIFAGAGASLADAARFALEQGLAGLEFACGIPGSVGGAVCMNAGAYGSEMRDVVFRSVFLDREGNVGLLDSLGHDFGYRKSRFQEGGSVILETEFLLAPGRPDEIAGRIAEYQARREASQPLDAPSAGSVFRRPAAEGLYVGPMIEACGMKGAAVGGAMVSEKHAGFIINRGGATAADVLELIRRVRAKVRERFSVDLETEIRVVGIAAEAQAV